MKKKSYLITPALPYVNGPLHLGHMLEQVQVNIFARAMKMAGAQVHSVCGADSHGTPIELSAQKNNVKPEEWIENWQKKYEQTLAQFGIEFDGGFQTTHSEQHKETVYEIYKRLESKNLIYTKEIQQAYDPIAKRFLPDRMIKGTCPKCKAKDQYGDSCEVCSSFYQATDLIDAYSVLTNATPIQKSTEHYFFNLQSFKNVVEAWGHEILQPEIRNYLNQWFEMGLKDWDISRDAPYFGFLIPGHNDKYLYVWLDAPIGYLSFAKKAINKSLEDTWNNKNQEIIHFIGKDIAYFHCLFWPSLLHAASFHLPSKVIVHGMLTINGEKMSKSRGTFILADTFAQHVNPQALRYYFACKISPKVEDTDLNFDDFINRVNADLVNKIVNIVSRVCAILQRSYNNQCGPMDTHVNTQELLAQSRNLAAQVFSHYEKCEFAKLMKHIVEVAEHANRYLQESAPWEKAKYGDAQAHAQLTTALWSAKVCIGHSNLFCPKWRSNSNKFCKLSPSHLKI